MEYKNDVVKIESLLVAMYDSLSGEHGKQRNWDRFANLFHPKGRMCVIVKNGYGKDNASIMTVPDFIQDYNRIIGEYRAFHEYQADFSIHRCGNVIHVFSTYESKINKNDPKPFKRGVNSIQIYYDYNRYWILNVFWDRTYNELMLGPDRADSLKRSVVGD